MEQEIKQQESTSISLEPLSISLGSESKTNFSGSI